ncbi:hypothetical protein DL96DRAFT_1609437 [Flagelloscypha sp. PMI_526]|nr:hypothetical protein DL96DRAFT_1609437 [Flagelloscypha sp. PMI_526]
MSSPPAPESYNIGKKFTPPLVKLPQLKGHLALLRAFLRLKERVDNFSYTESREYVALPNDRKLGNSRMKRWVCFVELAVERFEAWCQALKEGDEEDFMQRALPPIDVLMVWHAYMLNPGHYLEDCQRLPACKHLRKMSAVFSDSLGDLEDILNNTPSAGRLEYWNARCLDFPFDPFMSAKSTKYKRIRCPSVGCGQVFLASYIDQKGEGYLQRNFKIRCPKCNIEVTKESLSARRLKDDLASIDMGDLSHFLAGSLFTIRTTCDRQRAERAKDKFLEIFKENWVDVMNNFEEISLFETRVKAVVKSDPGTLRILLNILECYKYDKNYSTDLAAAVLRQFDFSEKMQGVGWTRSGVFSTDEDMTPLVHATARYHSFLDLMTTNVGFYVPTLDIDLAWHTHQLCAAQYESDCFEYIGRFIDHDDKVDSTQLGGGFDETCKAWQHRFGVRYAYCGCPTPPSNSVSQRLSRILNKPETPPHLTNFAQTMANDKSRLTHPSAHNVFTPPSTDKDFAKRKDAMLKEAEKRTAKDDVKAMDKSHQSYLVALPMFFETPVPGCGTYIAPSTSDETLTEKRSSFLEIKRAKAKTPVKASYVPPKITSYTPPKPKATKKPTRSYESSSYTSSSTNTGFWASTAVSSCGGGSSSYGGGSSSCGGGSSSCGGGGGGGGCGGGGC